VQGESTRQCEDTTDYVATLTNIYSRHMSLYLKIAIIIIFMILYIKLRNLDAVRGHLSIFLYIVSLFYF
jgi:hypothetical protein